MKQLLPIVIVSVLLCPGCGDPEEEEHIWKDQTDMIDKASDVEKTLMEANQLQRQQIDEMAQ